MLFNSYPFIFLFLPVTLIGFYALGGTHRRLAAGWLALASLFFYGWWDYRYVLLLAGSILFNFLAGREITRFTQTPRGKHLLTIAVAANLGLLGYYKYADFFIGTGNTVLGTSWELLQIVLPLGISFFTFTQIAFLVDAYRGLAKEYEFTNYVLFVTYFPHLIAGPVLHHKEMTPQFADAKTYSIIDANLSAGLTIFSFGLFKKAVIADNISAYATPVFEAAARGDPLTFFDAWGGALAYTFQLYFDFSGYSDMAIGLSLLFGIRLPLNFDSPYKATSIIEFWQRWHMTLSRFLRDYLYIPLGGNQHGNARRYRNLMVTMLLGGLWHGAGWTFVVWGALHGAYLVTNHGYRSLKKHLGIAEHSRNRIAVVGSVVLTFVAVVIAWVVFRAPTLDAAASLLRSMAGWNGIPVPAAGLSIVQTLLPVGGNWFYQGTLGRLFYWPDQVIWLLGLFAIAWLCPNTQQVTAAARPVLNRLHAATLLRWRPDAAWLFVVLLMFCTSLAQLDKVSEFLYFQF